MIPDSEAARIGDLPQVAEAMPVKLLMTSCQSTTDVVAVHGIDKGIFTKFRNYDLAPETLAAFRGDTSGALLGSKIARRYGWKTGDAVTLEQLKGFSFTVSGTFSTSGSPEDYLILVGRRFLQEATDEQGISNQVLVKVVPGTDPAAACEAIESLPLATKISCEMEEAFLATSLDQLRDIVAVSRLVIATIAVVTLIAVGNAVSMATRERSGEIGILRTLGFQKGAILRMVLLEGLAQTLVGGILGCLVAETLVRLQVLGSVSTCGLSVELTTGLWPWIGTVVGIAVAGTLGSAIPAWRLSRIDIAEAIRRED